MIVTSNLIKTPKVVTIDQNRWSRSVKFTGHDLLECVVTVDQNTQLLIQAFVSELSIETLDVAVLHRPARLNQNVANAMQSGSSQEGAACDFRTVICANCNWVASKNCSLI